MGYRSYLHELPEDSYLLPDVIKQGEHIVITAEALESLNAYETSTPTSPSAGRAYRRTYLAGPARTEPETFVFIVQDAPPDDPQGGRLHHPLLALVVES